MAFSGLKIAIDGLKGASDTLSNAKIEAAVADVRSALMTAQNVALSLQSDAAEHNKIKAALEKRIVDLTNDLEQLNDWKVKAACYKLVAIMPNSSTFAREFDPEKGKESGLDEPAHWACPACFEKRERSILCQEKPTSTMVRCPKCSYQVQFRELRQVPTVSSRGNWALPGGL